MPKARRLDLATRVSVSTTQNELRFHLTEDEQCGLAADGPCPTPPDGLNFAAVHQSLMTDMMNTVYVRQGHPQKLDVNALQVLSEVMHKTIPFGPFRDVAVRNRNDVRLTLELDFPDPFLVRFQGGHFGLTFRARQLRLRGGPVYPAHDVTLDYRLSVQDDGAVHFDKVGDPASRPVSRARPWRLSWSPPCETSCLPTCARRSPWNPVDSSAADGRCRWVSVPSRSNRVGWRDRSSFDRH